MASSPLSKSIGRAYDHPPRAVQDAKDLGFRIKRTNVRHTNGRSIATYEFDEGEPDPSKAGRRALPKKERDVIIRAAGEKCQPCGAEHNLQVDHRIPYEVAGEAPVGEKQPFQVLCGSCNRKKSRDCERCRNRLESSDPDICRSCYWADPTSYNHVAMRQERRADIVWIGDEVKDYERLRREAGRHKRNVTDEIKISLKN